jgi:hypothetical protein
VDIVVFALCTRTLFVHEPLAERADVSTAATALWEVKP